MDISRILEEHKKWLDSEGKEGKRADLCHTDLIGKNLEGAILKDANLKDADLISANLSGVNFEGANLEDANLMDANLTRAILKGANLKNANLYSANLSGANLEGANLKDAMLYRAHIYDANLARANLQGANLGYAIITNVDLACAILKDVNLNGALLRGVRNMPHIPMIVPETGSFIGWKKAKYLVFGVPTYCIVKLRITEDAKRSSGSGIKCRCSKAEVLAIETLDGKPSNMKKAHSFYDESFKYEVGKIVSINDFDENRFDECSKGIHFFMNRKEAVDYGSVTKKYAKKFLMRIL